MVACRTLLLVLALMPGVAAAQVFDTFEDGDFSTNPTWTGDVERWRVVERGDGRWLNTNGESKSDTLVLATPSAVSYGSWRFTFAHVAVNLSNANGVRIYLVADRADVRTTARGYFLQMGTNNADEVRLYRQDGPASAASNRVEIGRSGVLLDGNDGEHVIEVERAPDGFWTVRVDGNHAFTAFDATYESGTHFGLWVKHSSAAAGSFFFDDVEVAGTTGPPDVTPPRITSGRYDAALPGFALDFSEPLDPATVTADAFALSSGDAIAVEDDAAAARVALRLAAPLETGNYTLLVRGIADLAGNVMRDTTLAYEIVRDIEPPVLLLAAASSPHHIFVRFSEPVTNACDPLIYSLQPPDASIVAASCSIGTATDTLTLALSAPLRPGETYTLTAALAEDEAGNVQPGTSSTFRLPEQPSPGDVVINEIHYAPPAGVPEYVELLNVSAKTLDLSSFTIEDETGVPHAISALPALLPPGGYAVVTRDTAALALAFPGVEALQPSGWSALNNSGDAVVLRARGVRIDSLTYTSTWGGAGAALERRDPLGPSTSRANWGTTTDPSGGTPGRQNSLYAPDLSPPRVLRAEEIGESRFEVVFSEEIDPVTATASAFSLDAGSVRTVGLDSGALVIVTLEPNSAATALTIRGVRDLRGNVMRDTTVALAFRPRAGEIVINEILYLPLADPNDNLPDQPEYVELLSRSRRTLSLRHLVVAGAPNESGVADTMRLPAALPPLAPGGFVVIYHAHADDGDPATDSRLARAFPSVDFARPGVVLVPVSTVTRNGLSNSGERLHLIASGVSLDDVTYTSRWQDATLRTATGISIERLSAGGDSNDPLNWAGSAAAEGGTPGHGNSVTQIAGARAPQPGDLVINEILYQPVANPRDERPDQTEYVEIVNRSSDLLDLNGLMLLDAPDERGSADTLRLVYRPAALAPGGFAVFYRARGAYADAPDPAALLAEAFPGADEGLLVAQRSGAFSLPVAGRVLRLSAPGGAALDEVAYSSRWHLPSLRSQAGVALERISAEGSSDDPANWTSSPSPSGGTPGRRNGATLDPDDPDVPEQVGVQISPSPFSPDGDGVDDHAVIRYRLASAATSVRVRIFDQSGRQVRTLAQAQAAGPAGQVLWDGRDDEGRALRIGIYVVVLEALDAAAGAVESFRAPVVLARQL